MRDTPRKDDRNIFRQSLWPVSWIYGAGVGLRDALFRLGIKRQHRLPVSVVSVGNLTVGGTGKTPLVIYLVGLARELGHKPGVLARGYRKAAGEALNDEGKLLATRFPGLPQVQQPDRVAGGEQLLANHDVDLIILDDGFQHRRLARDTDLVCVDARNPFSFGLLPAGDLRELPSALCRADAVILTRAGGLDAEDLAARAERLQEVAGKKLPVLATEHAPSGLVAEPDGGVVDLAALEGQRVLLLSAIARPASFEDSVRSLGAEVVGHVARRDHHHHTQAELAQVVSRAEQDRARVLVTEKDEVKLGGMAGPRLVLHVDLRFLIDEPTPEVLGLAAAGSEERLS